MINQLSIDSVVSTYRTTYETALDIHLYAIQYATLTQVSQHACIGATLEPNAPHPYRTLT